MVLGRGAKAILLLAALVLVLAGIKLAAALLVPFFLAVFIAIVSTPIVIGLSRRRVPRWIGITLTIILDVAAVAGLAAVVGGSITAFSERLPDYQQSFEHLLEDTTAWLAVRGVHITPAQLAEVFDPGSLMGLVGSTLKSIAEVVSNVVLVLLIVVFMLFETVALREKMRRVLRNPDEDLERIGRTMHEIQKYLVVKTATSVLTGAVIAGWCAMLDVDLPVMWGLLAFLLNYIPTLGSIIAAVPPVLIALLGHGPGTALVVGSGYFVLAFAIGNFIEPRVLGRAVGLSPLIVFLSMVFWGWLLGPVGAILSVPLTMAVKIFFANTEDMQWIAVLLGAVRRPQDPISVRAPPTPVAVSETEATATLNPRR